MFGAISMSNVRRPASLRGVTKASASDGRDRRMGVATVSAIIAAGAASGAEAQSDNGLPAVTVDAPVTRPRPVASRPTAAQVRARNALRQRSTQARPQLRPSVEPSPSGGAGLPIFAQAPDANPYADLAAPYKANRLSGTKFTEPLINTPRTVTVLTKELLQDKNATSLKEVARTTNGITIGTGEGGNAFGDRFFIRGFDARNDIFIDGIRDVGVSIRENFFTEQIEILRGPGSTFAGRGVAGGAINIVTKQAGDRDFVKAEMQGGVTSDHLQRFTLDVNKVVSPDFSIRLNGMEQTAGVAGRDYIVDDRWGIGGAFKATPTDNLKITGSYFHTNLDGLPDFGVPFYRSAGPNGTIIGNLRPTPETFNNRDTFYGFVNRDFQRAQQDIGTLKGELVINEYATVTNTFHVGHSVLDYVGTIPEQPSYNFANPNLYTVRANPQSRYQTSDIIANQTDLTLRFRTGDIRHTLVAGVEVDRERVAFAPYTGLFSEGTGTIFNGTGSATVNLLNPPNLVPFGNKPVRSTNRTFVPVDTNAVYLIETANYNDFIILNGGVRFDNYNVSSRVASSPQTVSVESNLVNYNAGIVVKPVPFASLYGAIATSANPVGAELDASGAAYGGLSATSTAFQALPPEKNTAYEVGTKFELLDGRLLATAAAFETIKENAREQNGTINLATGKYTVKGLDFGLTGKITDKWSIAAGYTTFSAVVDKSYDPTQVGLRLANLANDSFSLFTKYKITERWELGGQAVFASKIYGGTFAANANEIPAHWRFDLFSEVKLAENVRATVNVQNLLDKTYYDAFYRSAAPFVFVAPGRTVTLSLRATF